MSAEQPSRLIRFALERHAAAFARQRTALGRLIGLLDSDILALEHLVRAGELTPGALAQRMGLSSGGTTALIHRLRRAGLVSRHPHPVDGRKAVLRPTAANPPPTEAASAALLAGLDELACELTPSERVTFERFLTRAADIAEQHADRLVKEARAAADAAVDLPAPVLWA
ncbi:MAG: MarR family transcriptional regulator, lower aerobic nicotinate degradation pathway regulator [Solirubrobacteraceae bacterium]